MISRMSHTTIYVKNQEEALRFYRDKLGFEVRTDVTMEGGFRWLTVGLKDQSDLEIVLMGLYPNTMMDENTVNQLKTLLEKGALGAGVFETKDCRATYEEYRKRGVEFLAPPEEKVYGIEALFKDNSGNWFSLTQHKEH
jgi:catechol 2,3-dioxygenase-like lactoylglutathione lyase family enzyme